MGGLIEFWFLFLHLTSYVQIDHFILQQFLQLEPSTVYMLLNEQLLVCLMTGSYI